MDAVSGRLGDEAEFVDGRYAINHCPRALSHFSQLHILNDTAGTTLESLHPKEIAVKTARDRSAATIFNYASMAFNNHFFYSGLHPEKQRNVPPPSKTFLQDIEASFGSLEALRAEFLATAEAMFGPGFVWLVKTTDEGGASGGLMKILNTYAAGSPFPQAHFRLQPIDMGTQTTNVIGGQSYSSDDIERMSRPQNAVGRFGPQSMAARSGRHLAMGGARVDPVLCLNTWEHVWLRDWGVHGKDGYVEAWWKQINWSWVEQEAAKYNMLGGGMPAAFGSARTYARPGSMFS